jgi:hypothetical protein
MARCFGETVAWQTDSTKPLVQLTGEHFQLYSGGVYFTDFTPGRTITNGGLLGADLGYPVVYPDKILIFFGDSLGVFRGFGERSDRFYLAGGPRGMDSIGYIPNIDFDRCNYIPEIDAQLARSNSRPTASMKDCPALRIYRNPQIPPGDAGFMPTTIRDLKNDEATGPYETPSGAFDYDGRIYMFYVVKVQDAKPHFALRSIVAKADKPTKDWSDLNPPTFKRLYAASSHAEVPDPANPPDEASGEGKFMFNPVTVMSHRALSDNHLLAGLPHGLRTASSVVFVFGSSFRYNRSDLYLAVFAIEDVEAGTEKWFYYTGATEGEPWSHDETAAIPLLRDHPNIGNHSVVWNDALHRFVLMYGNIMVRTAAAPWSVWSLPAQIFAPEGRWAQELIHQSDRDPIKHAVIPIYRHRTNEIFEFKDEKRGVPYGPYVIDKYTVNRDGSVNLFFTMSTWVPYQVFLMRTTVRVTPDEKDRPH